ncbi:MAG: uridine kinase [Elusimicrobia bacterium]|nr:uridine kinase [Elusimicrobiota bacterium]
MTLILAIDGRAAAGKTTFAKLLAKNFAAQIIHTDDFFLPPQNRVEKISGHMDLGGLKKVLKNLSAGKPAVYKPYDCARGKYKKEIKINPRGLIIVEGCYSLHPKLAAHYDQKIFMNISPSAQKKRILARGGKESLKAFQKIWIPEEEKYFLRYAPQKYCDMILEIK